MLAISLLGGILLSSLQLYRYDEAEKDDLVKFELSTTDQKINSKMSNDGQQPHLHCNYSRVFSMVTDLFCKASLGMLDCDSIGIRARNEGGFADSLRPGPEYS